MHIGKTPPQIERHAEPQRPLPAAQRRGDALLAIIDETDDWPADLIGMPTAGRHGFPDALHGSTTERVTRGAIPGAGGAGQLGAPATTCPAGTDGAG